MSDATGSAAAALMGNPPAPPAPPADAGNPPTPLAAPPAPPTSGNWIDSISDADTKTWAQGKGWKEPNDIIASYRNLEKLVGHEKIPLPKDASDAEGWERLYKAAGRPDAPEAYGLDKLEGADPAFAKSAAEAFHKAGLNPQQAQGLLEFYAGQSKAVLEAEETAFAQRSQAEMGELQKEWGPAFEAKTEAGRRAAMMAGIDQATAESIEKAIGAKAMMALFNKFGEALSESTFRQGGSAGGSGEQFLSPAQASAQKGNLLADPAFVARINSGDATAKAQLDRLQKIEAGISA